MIVGICGAMQAGKDSTVAVLTDYGFTRVAFADKLKNACYEINPWIERPKSTGPGYVKLQHLVDSLGWEVAKSSFPEVRKFLQEVGVSMRICVDTEIWVNAALRNRAMNLAISDVRFPNEWAAVKAGGGVMIRVERPGYNGDGHISERALDDYEPDYTIVNNGTLADLRVGVETILDHMEKS